jgi:hypothetical protein
VPRLDSEVLFQGPMFVPSEKTEKRVRNGLYFKRKGDIPPSQPVRLPHTPCIPRKKSRRYKSIFGGFDKLGGLSLPGPILKNPTKVKKIRDSGIFSGFSKLAYLARPHPKETHMHTCTRAPTHTFTHIHPHPHLSLHQSHSHLLATSYAPNTPLCR